MVQARRFHSNFLFVIPLTQGVLLIIILDLCKNAAFLANQSKNLSPYTLVSADDGTYTEKPKDSAYLAAQYIYAIWLILMIIKAIIGFRANLRFNVRWMSIYNILFGVDTIFEFIHTTLGAIFQDTSMLDEAGIVKKYCVGYLILFFQLYGFFCCWMHLRWVHVEMEGLFLPGAPRETLFELMIPRVLCCSRRSRDSQTIIPISSTVEANVTSGNNASSRSSLSSTSSFVVVESETPETQASQPHV